MEWIVIVVALTVASAEPPATDTYNPLYNLVGCPAVYYATDEEIERQL